MKIRDGVMFVFYPQDCRSKYSCTLTTYIAVDGDNLLISTRNDQEDHRDEEQDGPCNYQVVEIGARETNNPDGIKTTLVIRCGR